MTLYPDVQRRAQAEIDEVVGNHRLPTLADKEHLPYVCAVVKEVLRFAPVARLGELFALLWSYHIYLSLQAFLTVY